MGKTDLQREGRAARGVARVAEGGAEGRFFHGSERSAGSEHSLRRPLDRLLVATARHLGAVFLTADTRILDYARATGNVRVHDAGR